MTTVIAAWDGIRTHVAAGSGSTISEMSAPGNGGLCHIEPGLIIGFSGYAAVAVVAEDLARYAQDDVNVFADKMGETLAALNWKNVGDGGPPQYDIDLLIARPDGLWFIGQEMCVTHYPMCKAMAIGSGARFALGAYEALVPAGIDTGAMVLGAAQAAVELDLYTHGPSQYAQTEPGR